MSEATQAPELAPGFYPDIAAEVYHKWEAVSCSLILPFRQSAAHAYHDMMHPRPATEFMDVGTATHCIALEPEEFAKRVIEAPFQERTVGKKKKAWEAQAEEHPGKIQLRPAQMRAVMGMRQALFRHPFARELLQAPGKNECCMVWRGEETGLLCKSRSDKLAQLPSYSAIVDLKKCQSAAKYAFQRHAADFQYHVRAAWYLDGADVLQPATRRHFLVAVEEKAPHCVAVFEYDDMALYSGRIDYRRYMTLYKKCIESNEWPGYHEDEQLLTVPAYMQRT